MRNHGEGVIGPNLGQTQSHPFLDFQAVYCHTVHCCSCHSQDYKLPNKKNSMSKNAFTVDQIRSIILLYILKGENGSKRRETLAILITFFPSRSSLTALNTISFLTDLHSAEEEEACSILLHVKSVSHCVLNAQFFSRKNDWNFI